MTLTTAELRARAAIFAEDWKDARDERRDTQSFWNAFFDIFDMPRKRVATYEQLVEKLGGRKGFVDLFWPGVLMVEQKSAGRDLLAAETQLMDYTPNLRDSEVPRYTLVCDFQRWELRDLELGETTAFTLPELPKHIDKFGFILGRQKTRFKDQDPVNVKAAELVGHLHDALEVSGYTGHDLEQFLVRIVFCLFADDTGIFEPKDILWDFLEEHTKSDGSNTGPRLAKIFEVLDTPEPDRSANLAPEYAQFPHVNGALFKGAIRIPDFDADMQAALLNACRFDWTPISPAIFGSLFQSVMNPAERRAKGAHYTTEKNILKVIEPLFMDDLRAEFAHLNGLRSGRDKRLREFQQKLRGLTFFDPACGCGNFLIIAYRELRMLEIEVLRAIHGSDQLELDARVLSLVDVDQFFGIEYEEFPARIAETALWMMDHIMNLRLSAEFGHYYARIPLVKKPTILHGDALEVDWNAVLPAERCSYVLGNPPFVGHQNRTTEQVAGMHRVWGTAGQVNRLDYVTCWFKKAVEYGGKKPDFRFAFVSTNSICQGEQAGILWPHLFGAGYSIFFGHRTFQWNSEARGQAAVHCVIVGMTRSTSASCEVFEYETVKSEPAKAIVDQLNGYLVNGPQWALPARGKPQDGQPTIHKGSQPTDGARLKKPEGGYQTFSNLILDAEGADQLRGLCPIAANWLRPYVGGDELISGDWRYCLWLKDVGPQEIAKCPDVVERLKRVKSGRLQSPTPSVQRFADYPTLFTQDRQPNTDYIAIPEVSSERREYLPISLLGPDIIASNKLMIMPGGTTSDFGLLISRMHMAWMRTVAGRLESRYSYSPSVWFTFPLPKGDLSKLAPLAQAVLDARANHPGATLADLYDPDLMPADLRRAHTALDRAVDRMYRRTGFASDRERVEHLFQLYEAMVKPLLAKPKRRPRKRR